MAVMVKSTVALIDAPKAGSITLQETTNTNNTHPLSILNIVGHMPNRRQREDQHHRRQLVVKGRFDQNSWSQPTLDPILLHHTKSICIDHGYQRSVAGARTQSFGEQTQKFSDFPIKFN